MALAATAGRSGRPTLRLFAQVLEDEGRLCVWCGHGGSNAVNHTYPWARFPDLRMSRANLHAVHGREGCPVCPPNMRTGRPRACNSEIGDRILFVEVHPPAPASRAW